MTIRPLVLQQEIVGIDTAWALVHYYFFRLCLESQDIIWTLTVKFFLFVDICTYNKIRETNTFRLRLSRSCRHKFLWGRGYESVAECVSFIQVSNSINSWLKFFITNLKLKKIILILSPSMVISINMLQFVSICPNLSQSILINNNLSQLIPIFLNLSQVV